MAMSTHQSQQMTQLSDDQPQGLPVFSESPDLSTLLCGTIQKSQQGIQQQQHMQQHQLGQNSLHPQLQNQLVKGDMMHQYNQLQQNSSGQTAYSPMDNVQQSMQNSSNHRTFASQAQAMSAAVTIQLQQQQNHLAHLQSHPSSTPVQQQEQLQQQHLQLQNQQYYQKYSQQAQQHQMYVQSQMTPLQQQQHFQMVHQQQQQLMMQQKQQLAGQWNPANSTTLHAQSNESLGLSQSQDAARTHFGVQPGISSTYSPPQYVALSQQYAQQYVTGTAHGYTQSKIPVEFDNASGDLGNLDDDDDGQQDDDDGGILIKENTGRWTYSEHCQFLKGLDTYGKAWKKIASLIRTRTVVQIRTHAQKYFQKLAKAKQSGDHGDSTLDSKGYGGKRRRGFSKRKIDDLFADATDLAPSLQPFVDNTGAVEAGLYYFLSPTIVNDPHKPPHINPSAMGFDQASLSSTIGDIGSFTPVPTEPPQWYQEGRNVDDLLIEAESLDWTEDHRGAVHFDAILSTTLGLGELQGSSLIEHKDTSMDALLAAVAVSTTDHSTNQTDQFDIVKSELIEEH